MATRLPEAVIIGCLPPRSKSPGLCQTGTPSGVDRVSGHYDRPRPQAEPAREREEPRSLTSRRERLSESTPLDQPVRCDSTDGFGSLRNGRRNTLAHAEGLGV